jgi:hypothetical protein
MCNNLKSKQNETSALRIFMDGLINDLKISKGTSLYFPQVIFLKLDLIEEIFIRLEKNLNNFSSVNSSSLKILPYPIKIKIEKKHEAAKSKGFKYADRSYDASFNIVIDNDEQLKYAKNLLGLYTNLIKPFMRENAEVFRNESERSTRFLYIDLLHPENGHYQGKTFSNTKSNDFMVNAHRPMGPLTSMDSFGTFTIAHFRDRYRLGNSDKSIKRFNLDLNFFACYVKPMIEGITN